MEIVSRQLLNVLHHNKALWHEKWFGKGQCILIVEKVRDSLGNVIKRVSKVENPTIKYYITAPAFQEEHTIAETSFPIEKCDSYTSPIDQLDRHIAELTGQMDYYNETKGPGSKRRRRKLHDHRWVHGSDVNPCDHYIDRYIEKYKDCLDVSSPLDMAFADIEVDAIDIEGFPDEHEAPAPINLISYFYKPTKTLVQFALTEKGLPRPNPLVTEFIKNLDVERTLILAHTNMKPLTKAKLFAPTNNEQKNLEEIVELMGLSPDGLKLRDVPEVWKHCRCEEVDIQFFDDEISLIRAFLTQVKDIDRPDMIGFWNLSFDANTILNRLRKANIDPEPEFTPKEFLPWSLVDYQVDNFKSDIADKGDTFTVIGWTAWIDQMLLYAALRKPEGKKESNTLDFTLNAEIGENKLPYDGNIKNFPYKDFRRFMHYGALDTVPLSTLEEKTEDISLAWSFSMVTRTRISKILKKTTSLRNLASYFFRDKGLVLSNNRNKNKERVDTEKFEGAIVADPKLLRFVGTEIGNHKSNRVFDDAVDFDATALYPSIIRAANTDPAAQFGRITYPVQDTQSIGEENGVGEPAIDLTVAWACGDPIEIGRSWFGLPGVGELIDIVLDES
jgi:hypothetical protein